jgi:alpha-ketoglutarate-dependent taurine dioxygenase
VISYLRRLAWEHAVGFEWEPGDLLVLDNWVAMHGRLGFEEAYAGERQMYIALANT